MAVEVDGSGGWARLLPDSIFQRPQKDVFPQSLVGPWHWALFLAGEFTQKQRQLL